MHNCRINFVFSTTILPLEASQLISHEEHPRFVPINTRVEKKRS
ncbi:hypothetical protein AVDCRST_MAG92-5537 [uncultured Coleofasciculus sp.]|uniref:Uncharacterized protein n=1 Tax=uncultured Coleofasciculus sp. TaxID=1267456 RepID=A0A6J4KJE9_9CYAN|nr:hypothetical protein AVDCRST_MAG92-5537 [uncultured Coleofasciculus sp.]